MTVKKNQASDKLCSFDESSYILVSIADYFTSSVFPIQNIKNVI